LNLSKKHDGSLLFIRPIRKGRLYKELMIFYLPALFIVFPKLLSLVLWVFRFLEMGWAGIDVYAMTDFFGLNSSYLKFSI